MYLLWSDLKIKDKKNVILRPRCKPEENICGLVITKAFIGKKVKVTSPDLFYILSRMRYSVDIDTSCDENASFDNHTVISRDVEYGRFYINGKGFDAPPIEAGYEEIEKFREEFYEYFLKVHNQ
ncbi:hypothetical protein KLEP7_gp130 [Pseudaeromonas phage vB_PpeM_ KLEP7]|nr:hypothetical protein KLEP7_gp130 [Pseudaeromonas phage vB_PpeM_ KLEP7]